MAVKKKSSEITVGAVGLGYVGQPFVGAMAEAGFNVVGLDIDQNLINKLSEDYEPTVYEPGLKEIFKVHQANISFTSNYEVMMQKSDAIFLSVGTPLNSKGEPDSKSIEACVSEIAPRVKNGQLIILRSTVVPGTTRWLAEQIQKRTGLQPGTDFFVAFSPERTVSDCVTKFNNVHIKSKIKIVKQQRNEAQKAGQIEKSRELQNKLREMQLALTH